MGTGKWRRAAGLGPSGWWLVARALAWVLVAHAALRWLPYRRVLALFERGLPAPDGGGDDAELERLAEAVGMAARQSGPTVRCLRRSLALYRLVRSAGHPADLRIGVRMDEGRLRAHAWVETAGRVLGDRPDVAEDFAPLVAGQAARSGLGSWQEAEGV